MPACAIERRRNTSQEPLYTEIYRKNAAPQNLGPHFVRACAVEMHVNISQEPLQREFTAKMPRPSLSPERGHTLCASMCSRNVLTFHKSHFIRKFTGKVPQTSLSPECGHTLCASLRSRNACRDCTRATSYGNSQEEGSRPEQAP